MAIEAKIKQEDKDKVEIDFPTLMESDSGNILLATGYDDDGSYKGILLQVKKDNLWEGYSKIISNGWNTTSYKPLEGEVVLKNK